MSTDAKVVHLNKATLENQSTSSPGRLPVALINLRDKAAQQLKQALQALFDNADDTLFQMADRSSNNLEQNVFFEAMRDLRLKRRSIERSFIQKMFERFGTLNQYQIGKSSTFPEDLSHHTLSLVQNDELEERVAIDSMVAKAISREATRLTHLTTRLNVLISRKLDDRSNPLGPDSLCADFLTACQELSTDIRVKLIVLKLFEKYVLTDLDSLYSDANQSLIAAGVLPELQNVPARARGNRPLYAKAPPATVDSPATTSTAGIDEEDTQALFGALQDLLAELRNGTRQEQRRPADATPISSNDLLRLLSHIQSRLPQAALAAPATDSLDLRTQLDQLLARASSRSGRSRILGEVDEDIINLVAMLFEFILDDRNLPDSIKALIGRLQMPVLKVAVLDKGFFSRASHPARRLLNEIASAAMGWSDRDELERDALYQKIEQMVARLQNDFVDDPAIFSELLAEFLAYTGAERKRSELIEQRTRDAEEGRAKAEIARQEVEQALNERLLGKTLPHVVVCLLQEAWSKVLLLTCLKHGTQSEAWSNALDTMDELIWSVQPHLEPNDRQQLPGKLPSLLKSLREGLNGAAFDPFAASQFFNELEQLHLHALRQPEPTTAMPSFSGPHEVETGQVMAGHDEAPIAQEAATAQPTLVEVREEIVLLAPGETREPEPEVSLSEDDEALQKVDNLHVGSWVEFQEDDEHKLRCKLAALIRPTGKYVFVNRTGMKVLEKTRSGLAMEFRRGAIRLLDDALLFDRALESIIGNLRRLKAND